MCKISILHRYVHVIVKLLHIFKYGSYYSTADSAYMSTFLLQLLWSLTHAKPGLYRGMQIYVTVCLCHDSFIILNILIYLTEYCISINQSINSIRVHIRVYYRGPSLYIYTFLIIRPNTMCVELDMKGIHVACICILVQVHVYYLQSFLLKKWL